MSGTNCCPCLTTPASWGESGAGEGISSTRRAGLMWRPGGRSVGHGSGEHYRPGGVEDRRRTAGLTVAEAAEKLGLKDSAKASAVEKLQGLEDGKPDVRRNHTAEGRFPLSSAPDRLLSGRSASSRRTGREFPVIQNGITRENATLDALLRDVRARQQMVREVIEEADETEPRTFVGSARIADGPAKVAASIRATLGITEDQQRRTRDAGALFTRLRAADRKGRGLCVPARRCRVASLGYRRGRLPRLALASSLASFIVINDNDAGTARSFTLLHELVHVWLGASGISGPLRGVRKTSSNASAMTQRVANSSCPGRRSAITRVCCTRP